MLYLSLRSSPAEPEEQPRGGDNFEEERKRGKTGLFRVRLDDSDSQSPSVFSVDKGWVNLTKNSRHIGDFTDWRNHDSYQRAFDRLLRDLKAGQPPFAPGIRTRMDRYRHASREAVELSGSVVIL
ncbi:MAG: hypothetical protein HY318_03335 [Armatimonadetes bacterium]|nr:hypothetical protein [Armatimonadota bacterium]